MLESCFLACMFPSGGFELTYREGLDSTTGFGDSLTCECSVHDGDVIPMLAALDIFPSAEHLPTTRMPPFRTWRTSQVVPMGGRVIFERLSCQSPTSPSLGNKRQAQHPFKTGEESLRLTSEFVRININDGIVALPTCSSGPGSSCPLDQFRGLVRTRGAQIGDFRETCGLGPDAAARITFLHQ